MACSSNFGKDDPSRPGGSSGFGGAERLELFKNIHVVMHDVGKSGLLPGASGPHPPAKGNPEATVQSASGDDQEKTLWFHLSHRHHSC